MIKLAQTMLLIVFAALAVVGGVYVKNALDLPGFAWAGSDPIRHQPAAPTIGQVRELASLVVLDVPITDMHVAELGGLTGGVKLAMAVAGDVQVATDLDAAEFVAIDRDAMTAILALRRPAPGRPRIDHEQTRILQIQRSGMWAWMPGETGEKTLADRAMLEAQRRLLTAAQNKPELVAQACARTERVIGQFYQALGWNVVVQWDDGVKTARAAG